MRVGILGGTFDPVHLGHLIVAEQARVRLDLDRVIFIPAGQPWLRAEQPAADGPDRLRMVELAVKSNPAFEASSQEIDRPGPTYTVDTLEVLKEELSREPDADTVLHYIIGMDALEQFHRWKDPERVVELCHLVIVNRPGHQGVDVNDVVGRYPEAGTRLTLLNVPRIEISSTEIRTRVSEGISIRYLAPDSVEEYIREQGLYRGS